MSHRVKRVQAGGERGSSAGGPTAWGGCTETHGSAPNGYTDGYIPTAECNGRVQLSNAVSRGPKLRDVERGEAVMHRVMYKNPGSS